MAIDWDHLYPYGKPKTLNERLQEKRHDYELFREPRKVEVIDTILNNWRWLDLVIPDESCAIPLIAKYLVYAHIDRPNDEIVDDMYIEAMRIAIIGKERWGSDCPQPASKEESPLVDLCYLAMNPAKTRTEKILAVEKVVSLRHTHGPVFELLCPTIEATTKLVDTLLVMLAEE